MTACEGGFTEILASGFGVGVAVGVSVLVHVGVGVAVDVGVLVNVGVDVAVVISDTFGRPWRRGVTDVAIGCAGIGAIVDLRGTTDALGRELMVTEVAAVDEIAAAAAIEARKKKKQQDLLAKYDLGQADRAGAEASGESPAGAKPRKKAERIVYAVSLGGKERESAIMVRQ